MLYLMLRKYNTFASGKYLVEVLFLCTEYSRHCVYSSTYDTVHATVLLWIEK